MKVFLCECYQGGPGISQICRTVGRYVCWSVRLSLNCVEKIGRKDASISLANLFTSSLKDLRCVKASSDEVMMLKCGDSPRDAVSQNIT